MLDFTIDGDNNMVCAFMAGAQTNSDQEMLRKQIFLNRHRMPPGQTRGTSVQFSQAVSFLDVMETGRKLVL